MTIRGNLVVGNVIGEQAGYGWGGIFFNGTNARKKPRVRFEGNRWIANSAPGPGSGLFIDDSALGRISHDLFHDIECGESGSALYVDGGGTPARGSRAVLRNVTVANNRCGASVRGSAIFVENRSSVAITRSVLSGNGGGSHIFAPRTTESTIAKSIVGGRTVGVRRGAGVRGGDPGFVDPAAGDFRLKSGSDLGAYGEG